MVDWSRVAELKRDFGEEDFAEVFELFQEEAGEVVRRIRHGESADLGRDLHFVKGSAENMGMSELAAFCRTGESAVAEGAPVDLAAIGDIYETCCAQIRRGEPL